MDTLQSWILIVWMVVAISLVTIQAYRLARWKEERGEN
jgi:hypothetical protein